MTVGYSGRREKKTGAMLLCAFALGLTAAIPGWTATTPEEKASAQARILFDGSGTWEPSAVTALQGAGGGALDGLKSTAGAVGSRGEKKAPSPPDPVYSPLDGKFLGYWRPWSARDEMLVGSYDLLCMAPKTAAQMWRLGKDGGSIAGAPVGAAFGGALAVVGFACGIGFGIGSFLFHSLVAGMTALFGMESMEADLREEHVIPPYNPWKGETPNRGAK